MSSTFFGLTVAYTGLLASNASLNTTSNNIANVQTEGYSRQQVVQQAASALRVFQTYGCVGAGVETLAVERIRDEFYDHKYWNNNTKVGEYEIKQYYMEQVETYFEDDGTKTGFKTIYDQFMVKGMQELLKDPSSASAKAQFIGYAGALTEYFNSLSGNLKAMQKDLNQELKLKVDEINSLAGEIATLNKQINVIELGGNKANELRDRRTLLLDQLSEIVDIEVIETPIVDANNPDRETGGNRFMVKIAGGQVLVDTNEYNGLECVARTHYEKVNQTDIDGLYDVYWKGGEKFNLYNTSMGGSLQGLVEMRDGNNNEGFNGKVTGIGTVTGADGVNRDTVTVQVNQSYLQDLNKNNLSDQGGIIDLGNKEFYYDSWEYQITYDADGKAVYSYTFTLSDNEKNSTRLTNDRVGKTASVGTSINYQGVPYYMSQMNEWVRTFSQKFNDMLSSGYTSDNRVGSNLFTGNSATGKDQYTFPDGSRYDTYSYEAYQAQVAELVAGGMSEVEAKKKAGFRVKVDDESYIHLTANNFTIVSAMIGDPDLLATKKSNADGAEQDDLLKEIKAMAYDKDKLNFRGSSASEFLQGIMSDIALNASRADTFYENFSNIKYTIETQRLSISGVDEDEEAVNLVKYQNGYNLASKMIQTLTEIYDRLILQTGV